MRFEDARRRMPLIAILRGVRPDEVVDVGRGLVGAGFTMIEVPLNSPSAMASIAALADALKDEALIGAGTVLTAEDARRAAQSGAGLVLAPNTDAAVIAAAVAENIAAMPGVATATEAFAAIAAGAAALKLFPASVLGTATVSAWRAVLPAVPMFAVGGVSERDFVAFGAAGVDGFGLGTSLYRPGDAPDSVAGKAAAAVSAMSFLLKEAAS